MSDPDNPIDEMVFHFRTSHGDLCVVVTGFNGNGFGDTAGLGFAWCSTADRSKPRKLRREVGEKIARKRSMGSSGIPIGQVTVGDRNGVRDQIVRIVGNAHFPDGQLVPPMHVKPYTGKGDGNFIPWFKDKFLPEFKERYLKPLEAEMASE